jgi:hypothetical protein
VSDAEDQVHVAVRVGIVFMQLQGVLTTLTRKAPLSCNSPRHLFLQAKTLPQKVANKTARKIEAAHFLSEFSQFIAV